MSSFNLESLNETLPEIAYTGYAVVIDGNNGNEESPTPTATHIKPDIKELASKIVESDFSSPEALRLALKEQGIENPSKSLMKALAEERHLLKCCSCPVVSEDYPSFFRHLKEEGHKYGNKKYLKDRRVLMIRIKKRLADLEHPDADFFPDIRNNNSDRLSKEEIKCWANIDSMESISKAERATYYGYIHISVCLLSLQKAKKQFKQSHKD